MVAFFLAFRGSILVEEEEEKEEEDMGALAGSRLLCLSPSLPSQLLPESD